MAHARPHQASGGEISCSSCPDRQMNLNQTWLKRGFFLCSALRCYPNTYLTKTEGAFVIATASMLSKFSVVVVSRSLNIVYVYHFRTMGWRRTTWRIWLWGWELPPTACTWPRLIAGKAPCMTAASHANLPMTFLPLWWSWSVLQRASWLGSTGNNSFTTQVSFALWIRSDIRGAAA